jgi:hypothetical protein
MARQVKTGTIYQIKVTLKDSKPPIWWRIQVSGETNLYKLHRILQKVMGWEDYHLHQFEINKKKYVHPDAELEDVQDERKFKLVQLPLKEGSTFIYGYDFGDSWDHELLVEKISPSEETRISPLCLGGERACPPEDCGGIWGYEEFLEAIKDPKHERHEKLLNWIGGVFDPEAFDLNAINKGLRRIK